MKIFLYCDDIDILKHWQNHIDGEVVYEYENLYALQDCIIVINYTAFESDVKESIKSFSKNKNHVLVLHSVPNMQNAKEILKVGARGYGNIYMKGSFLNSAIDTLKEDMVWLYPEFTTQLIMGIEFDGSSKNDELLKALTPREREVALLVKEGLTYKQIADELGIGVRTAKSHIQSCYNKLGVKDRLSLAMLLR